MSRREQHAWCVDDIPYGRIEAKRVQANCQLFYLLASASFVEVSSELYTENLLAWFAGDNEMTDWLRNHWLVEELRHGTALKRYINAVWPEFDWVQV